MTTLQRSFTLDPETEAYLDRRLDDGDDADALALRRLIEAGEASGLSDADSDAFSDRLEQRRAVRQDRP